MGKTYVAIYQNQVYTFDNWGDCKTFVEDKGDNVRFKSFVDEIDIKAFVDQNIKKNLDNHLKDVLYAYVYGMRYTINKEYIHGWSYLLVRNGQKEFENAGLGNDSKIAVRYHVNGEIAGVINAIEYAMANQEKRIIIYYQFLGIEMWANGSWKPKKEEYINYTKFIKEAKKKIAIDFIPVNQENFWYKQTKKICDIKYRNAMRGR